VTLDEMLALLDDNTTGDITAGDLRDIVTGLYELASTVGQVFSYQWTTAATPNTGKVTMDLPWAPNASTLLISETTDSGEVLTFSMLDDSPNSELRLSSGSSKLSATVTGPSVDMGTYREVPISVTEVVGVAPAANAKTSVGILAVLG
jgi:hypothetical protein